jgi:hypothetical protein
MSRLSAEFPAGLNDLAAQSRRISTHLFCARATILEAVVSYH